MKIVNWLRWPKNIGGRSHSLWRSAVSVQLLLQQTAAATIAWLIADLVLGQSDPFFAPLAAVVGLNAPLGERGRNTLRLVLGVVVGILTGELAIAVIGGGSPSFLIA